MNKTSVGDKFKIYLISTITVTLFGEMYFFPFQDPFRFSLGVIAFSIILLFYDDIKELYLGIFTGISVLVLRSLLYYFEGNLSLIELIKINLPSAIYYIVYAITFYMIRIRKYREFPGNTIYYLSMADVVSNIGEAIIRASLNSQLIVYIIIIAISRSTITYIIYYFLKRREISIKKLEHEDKYNQLNAIISNIQSEIFYLTKSQSDIENVMSKAYKLYEKTKGDREINNLALDLSREIHEIKKDYYRATNGFKSVFDNLDYDDSMYLDDIASIIVSNSNKYVEYLGKDIIITFNLMEDVKVRNYYYLFTIINNLITNAIDAIDKSGKIYIEDEFISESYILTVTDNGSGIDKDYIEYIFNPGFTTKYDLKTGKSSTGIGLSHVKHIVENLNGTIKVNSEEEKGTKFTVSIHTNELRRYYE